MRQVVAGLVIVLSLSSSSPGWAGGSNYGVDPGTRPRPEGKISEWPVPTPNFARDPAPGPDGNIYVAVMFGNTIARFDTKAIVDAGGRLWYVGSHNGRLGVIE